MEQIKLVEVGPRDGLQNEADSWSVADRIAFINLLSQCQFSEIEVGSFVSPKWVPQMAQTDKVFQAIEKTSGIRYSCLVPNQMGLDAAQEVGVQNISLFTAASETFNQKNINCSIDESFERFKPLMRQAQDHHLRVRGYVSCVIECPYAGPIMPEQVTLVAAKLLAIGCDEISLGDTIGKGTPDTIKALLTAVCAVVPLQKLAIHCHDTYGNAIDNISMAVELGIRVIDSAMGGLGGCPYAGGQAKGNVATETVVKMLRQQGFLPDFNMGAMQRASAFVAARKTTT
jgi:hydroxymethylglutaryl-CoA lyase